MRRNIAFPAMDNIMKISKSDTMHLGRQTKKMEYLQSLLILQNTRQLDALKTKWFCSLASPSSDTSFCLTFVINVNSKNQDSH